MVYWFVGTTILLGIWVLFMLAKRPHYHKNVTLAQIRIHLDALLKRGNDGAFLVIEHTGSDKFLQFAKYIKQRGNIGIELSFPKAPWSKQYYEKLKDFLRGQQIAFKIQAVSSQPVTEFIDVDCGSDTDLAFRLVEGVFRDVFQVDGELLFRIRGENISSRDELIDS